MVLKLQEWHVDVLTTRVGKFWLIVVYKNDPSLPPPFILLPPMQKSSTPTSLSIILLFDGSPRRCPSSLSVVVICRCRCPLSSFVDLVIVIVCCPRLPSSSVVLHHRCPLSSLPLVFHASLLYVVLVHHFIIASCHHWLSAVIGRRQIPRRCPHHTCRQILVDCCIKK